MLLEIHELAYQEYIDSYVWYEEQQAGLGALFQSEIQKILESVGQTPNQFPKIHKNYRQAVCKKFPFVIVFEIYPRKKIIHIAAIRHMKRKVSGKFKRRNR